MIETKDWFHARCEVCINYIESTDPGFADFLQRLRRAEWVVLKPNDGPHRVLCPVCFEIMAKAVEGKLVAWLMEAPRSTPPPVDDMPF